MMAKEKIHLEPILYDKMDILFIPLNPPKKSTKNKHYFSRTEVFWKILSDHGLITKEIWKDGNYTTADDIVFHGNSRNFQHSIFGIHDLMPDKLESNSKKVKPELSPVNKILSVVKKRKIKVVCLMHSKVYKSFKKSKDIDWIPDSKYGHIGTFKKTKIFRVPFPSYRNYQADDPIWGYYSELKDQLQ